MGSKRADTAARRKGAEKLTREFRSIFAFLFGISGIINLLALTGAFYMLQIYDRALSSGSIPTLVAISALAIGLYCFQGLFDILRSQILVRVGARLDRKVAPMAHEVAVDMPRFGFAVILAAMAHLSGLHRPGRRLGTALAEHGVNELRVIRLLRARGERLLDTAQVLARHLAALEAAFDQTELARLVLSDGRDWANEVRHTVARDYYRRLGQGGGQKTGGNERSAK
jgi:CRISPR type I-E-associated protein CasB/Cse2